MSSPGINPDFILLAYLSSENFLSEFRACLRFKTLSLSVIKSRSKISDSFNRYEFENKIAKYVRKNHVQTDETWRRTWKKAQLNT